MREDSFFFPPSSLFPPFSPFLLPDAGSHKEEIARIKPFLSLLFLSPPPRVLLAGGRKRKEPSPPPFPFPPLPFFPLSPPEQRPWSMLRSIPRSSFPPFLLLFSLPLPASTTVARRGGQEDPFPSFPFLSSSSGAWRKRLREITSGWFLSSFFSSLFLRILIGRANGGNKFFSFFLLSSLLFSRMKH